MKKKIYTITSLFVIITMLSGCFVTDMLDNARGQLFESVKFEDDTGYTKLAKANIANSAYYEPNKSSAYGYDCLDNETQRDCYNSMCEAVYKISEEQNEYGLYAVGKVNVLDKSFTEIDLEKCIKAFSMDHPEVFWLANRYTYGAAGNQFVVQMYSFVGAGECRKRITKLTDAVNSIMTNIPSGLNEYHLEKYIHNTVIDGCTYAAGVKDAEDGWEEFTVYGTLINGSAVCEGYSHTMEMLLNKVGIECYYVNGYGENNPHMWNIVKINDNWYHLDATWDDNENAYYHYFNIDDKTVKHDHIISPLYEDTDTTSDGIFNLWLPECNSDSANYFVVESTYIDDFNECRDTMVTDLINAAENHDTEFTIRFDTAIDFNEALRVMFNGEPYYMFDYISAANEQLDDGNKINDENVSIIILEQFSSVVVKLEYL